MLGKLNYIYSEDDGPCLPPDTETLGGATVDRSDVSQVMVGVRAGLGYTVLRK